MGEFIAELYFMTCDCMSVLKLITEAFLFCFVLFLMTTWKFWVLGLNQSLSWGYTGYFNPLCQGPGTEPAASQRPKPLQSHLNLVRQGGNT